VHGQGRHPRPRADGHRRGGRPGHHPRAGTATCARKGCPRSSGRSWYPKARPTTGSCTCPTCCPPPGRRSSTPRYPQVVPLVLGLGPMGDMATRVARFRGAGRVIGVDLVPERLERAPRQRPRDARPDPARRRGRHRPRADRRARPGLGHRRGRHGGARFPGRQARPAGGRPAARRSAGEADGEGRRGPAGRVPSRDRRRAARRPLGALRAALPGKPGALRPGPRAAPRAAASRKAPTISSARRSRYPAG